MTLRNVSDTRVRSRGTAVTPAGQFTTAGQGRTTHGGYFL